MINKTNELFLFDLDGTIYKDSELIGDVKNTLNKIRESGSKIVYLTNNSSCTKLKYEEKLKNLGIFEKEDLVYSSLDCAIDFLLERRKNKTVYVVGTEEVKNYMISKGVNLASEETENSLIDIVLLTFDKELNYKKIVKANELMVENKEYISTHPDYVCPTKTISIPDAGSFMEMFKSSSSKTPSVIIGKPYTYMAEYLLNKLKIKKENAVMVGDRLYTDIKFGINSQIKTILVLSGETTLKMLEESNVKPTLILKDVNEIVNLLK